DVVREVVAGLDVVPADLQGRAVDHATLLDDEVVRRRGHEEEQIVLVVLVLALHGSQPELHRLLLPALVLLHDIVLLRAHGDGDVRLRVHDTFDEPGLLRGHHAPPAAERVLVPALPGDLVDGLEHASGPRPGVRQAVDDYDARADALCVLDRRHIRLDAVVVGRHRDVLEVIAAAGARAVRIAKRALVLRVEHDDRSLQLHARLDARGHDQSRPGLAGPGRPADRGPEQDLFADRVDRMKVVRLLSHGHSSAATASGGALLSSMMVWI